VDAPVPGAGGTTACGGTTLRKPREPGPYKVHSMCGLFGKPANGKIKSILVPIEPVRMPYRSLRHLMLPEGPNGARPFRKATKAED
jgi:hypothetical protein